VPSRSVAINLGRRVSALNYATGEKRSVPK
jgi:hypothetical protein